MNAIYAALICMAGALICAVLRAQKPEFAIAVALTTGIAALTVCIPEIKSAAEALGTLTAAAGVGGEYSQILLRACGIALIGEFAMQICTDAGESALAGRIKLAMRLALLAMAVPLLAEVLSRCVQLLSL